MTTGDDSAAGDRLSPTRRRVLSGAGAAVATSLVAPARADRGCEACPRSTRGGDSGRSTIDRAAVGDRTEPDGEADDVLAKTNAAPTIDGEPESLWDDVRERLCDVIVGTRDGRSDIEVSWKGVWDHDNLYVFVDVTDEDISNDSGTTWKDDSVELYIDGDNAGGDSYDGNDYELMFDFEDPTVVTGLNSATDTTGMEFATVETDPGWACEIKIPLETIEVPPRYGTTFGFDVHHNDDDGGGERNTKLSWFATEDLAWRHPRLFADVALGTSTVGPSGPSAPADLRSPARTKTSMTIAWDAPDDAEAVDGYNVYLDGGLEQEVAGDATRTTVDELTEDETYDVLVTAADADGNESDAAGPLALTLDRVVTATPSPTPTETAATPTDDLSNPTESGPTADGTDTPSPDDGTTPTDPDDGTTPTDPDDPTATGGSGPGPGALGALASVVGAGWLTWRRAGSRQENERSAE